MEEKFKKNAKLILSYMSGWIILLICLLIAYCIKSEAAQPPQQCQGCQECKGWLTNASYYGKDYRGKPTANWREGWIFNPDQFTTASWDYNFGATLLVTNADNGLKVFVVVTDRGPAKRLYFDEDVRLDLSRAAYDYIKGESREGRLRVFVELVEEVEVEVSYE